MNDSPSEPPGGTGQRGEYTDSTQGRQGPQGLPDTKGAQVPQATTVNDWSSSSHHPSSSSHSSRTNTPNMQEGSTRSTEKVTRYQPQQQFIQTLRDLLEDPDMSDAISWNETGTAIVINSIDAFHKKVLGVVFKTTSFSSIIRQLNLYGFRKVYQLPAARESSAIVFHHKEFIRAHPERMANIVRRQRRSGRRSKRKASESVPPSVQSDVGGQTVPPDAMQGTPHEATHRGAQGSNIPGHGYVGPGQPYQGEQMAAVGGQQVPPPQYAAAQPMQHPPNVPYYSGPGHYAMHPASNGHPYTPQYLPPQAYPMQGQYVQSSDPAAAQVPARVASAPQGHQGDQQYAPQYSQVPQPNHPPSAAGEVRYGSAPPTSSGYATGPPGPRPQVAVAYPSYGQERQQSPYRSSEGQGTAPPGYQYAAPRPHYTGHYGDSHGSHQGAKHPPSQQQPYPQQSFAHPPQVLQGQEAHHHQQPQQAQHRPQHVQQHPQAQQQYQQYHPPHQPHEQPGQGQPLSEGGPPSHKPPPPRV